MTRVRAALAFLTALLLLVAHPAFAEEEVDLELVLLADASGSIDDAEIQFQRLGYATAITHPQVINAILQGYAQRIALTYVEWGDETSQEIVVPWTIIDGPESAAAFANALLEPPRLAWGFNAIGSALLTGQALIETNDFDGLRKVIDFSADSANNFGGPPIEVARAAIVASGTIINGLAILCRDDNCGGRPNYYDLEAAFAEQIVGGPGAFVVTVDGRDSFADAVRKKLVLEIAGSDPSSSILAAAND